MAVDAGDVVITFLGDTTQLDQAFAQAAGRTAELNETAAMSTTQLRNAQTELRAALAAVTAEGGNTVANMERLAAAEEQLAIAAQASRDAHAAMNAELIETSTVAEYATTAFEELQASISGFLAVFALIEMGKQFVERTQESLAEIYKFNQITGISVETLAGLEKASNEAGVSFEKVVTGVEKLSKSQQAAIDGNTKMQTAFGKIGITLEQLRELKPDELFFKVGEALGNMTNKSEAMALAQQLQGKGAAELLAIYREHKDNLEEYIETEGKASGVTQENTKAAHDWDVEMARIKDALRADLLPAFGLLVPMLKALETAGTVVASVFRTLWDSIKGLATAIFDSTVAGAKVWSDLLHGNVQQAIADSKAGQATLKADWSKTFSEIGGSWKGTADYIEEVWKKHGEEQKKHQQDTQEISKETTKQLLADAKVVEDRKLVAIQLELAMQKLLFDQGKIGAQQWAEAQVKAVDETRKAHEAYAAEEIRIYKAAGDLAKVRDAEEKAHATQMKDDITIIKELDDAVLKAKQADSEWAKTEQKAWKEAAKDIVTYGDAAKQIMKDPPIPKEIANLVKLNKELKALGIEGWGFYASKVKLAEDAEKKLTDMGLKGTKLWLEAERARLKATIQMKEIEGKATKQEIHDLQQVEHELKTFGQTLKDQVPTMEQMWGKMSASVGQFALDMGDAFAAVIQGQESMSKAVLKAVGKMIGDMAKAWAQYFMAKALADLYFAPPLAAAELAAAAALELVGSLAASLGGGGGAKGSASGQATSSIEANAATGGHVGATATGNVARFQLGGLVTAPTIGMIGEGFGAHRQNEGVIPLGDPRALTMIGKAIAEHLPQPAHGGAVTITLETDIHQTIKRINNVTSTGRAKLRATDSTRLTRRSV